jgi:hypothetical protein
VRRASPGGTPPETLHTMELGNAAAGVLFGAVVRNPQVPYTVRFNVLLALMIDIVLIVVQLAMQILLRNTFGNTLLLRTLDNTIFLGTILLLSFALVECLRGKEPDVPTLSEAVRMQLY